MFNDQTHKEAFLKLCPGKLLNDSEWSSTVFVLTSDAELRRKATPHIKIKKREIDWDKILSTDFGSGHYSAIYWAFTLWSGNSWPKDDGSRIDTMSEAYYMDEELRKTAITALKLRWKMIGFR